MCKSRGEKRARECESSFKQKPLFGMRSLARNRIACIYDYDEEEATIYAAQYLFEWFKRAYVQFSHVCVNVKGELIIAMGAVKNDCILCSAMIKFERCIEPRCDRMMKVNCVIQLEHV